MSDENGNENRFELGGKTFVALEWSPCFGCTFADFPGKCSNYARPPCDPDSRKDGKETIFPKSAGTCFT